MDDQPSCPTWCNREHVTDPTMDQIHERLMVPVPVIMLNRSIDRTAGALYRIVEAAEFEVVAYQYVNDNETWIAIVDGEQQRQRFEISLESARRLMKRVLPLLDSVDGSLPSKAGSY